MKKIGIKLADGSFFPVMEEGKAGKEVLDLTTAHNDQTTVQVDLYRSENGTMDDAEYVDTLKIDNLVEHPNGEPDISLDISLDDENKLSAELHDPESGGESHTTVSLVSRTLAEREQDTTTAQGASLGVGLGGGLAAAAAAMLAAENKEETAVDEPVVEETPVEEPAVDDIFAEQTQIEDPVMEDFQEEPVADEPVAEEPVAEDPIIEEPVIQDVTQESVFEDMPQDEVTSDSVVEESVTDDATIASEEEKPFDIADFDMPMDSSFSEQIPVDEDVTEETNDDATVASDDIPVDNISVDEPMFNDPMVSDSIKGSDEETSFASESSDDFTVPDFVDMNSTESKDESTESDTNLDFSDLYDKETQEGYSSTENQTKEIKAKTRAPVIICITCAAICIIAVILLFFIIPSKFNLIKSRNTKNKEVIEKTVETPKEEVKEAPKAKENEVVVSETPEILPEKPAKKEAPKTQKYKIKWGDTLWDISETYYKNPWKYKYLARYNGIKNPDKIISGTYIVIPEK